MEKRSNSSKSHNFDITVLCTYYIRTYSDLASVEFSKYTQSPLIRTTAKLPTLGVLKNSSNLDAHWFLILQG